MARRMWLSIIVLAAAASVSRADILVWIDDPIDDWALVRAVSGQKPVKEAAAEIWAWEEALLATDESSIEKLLGKPGLKPQNGYAIPVGQHRMYGISGLRHADKEMNKDHTAYYPIGDFAGIEVRYGIDGTTPQYAVLYFKVDDAFPKLKKVEADKPAEPKKAPAAIRKHAIDWEHWEAMKDGMTKEQITDLFSAPPGDYAPGTDYLTGGARGDGAAAVTGRHTRRWNGGVRRRASSLSSMRRGTTSPLSFTIPAATLSQTSPSG